jgi:hypothetical protein
MKKNLLTTLLIMLGLILVKPIYAADPSFSIYPSTGTVTVGKTFTIDVLIDSSDNDITQARAVLLFDPELVQVVKPEYNASLFCSYPSGQQSVDNTNGVVMLTGFCQSGAGSLYKTEGGADVLARIQFEVKKAGTIKIEWNHDGTNKDFMSVILKDGSPPSNVLTAKPALATFTTTGGSSTGTPEFPSTAISPSMYIILSGVFLILFGLLYLYLGKKSKSKMRTVVLYE